MSIMIRRITLVALLCAAVPLPGRAGLVPTAISAEAGLVHVDVSTAGGVLSLDPRMHARLTRSADGEPLAGKLLTFTVGGRDVCTEPTDEDGVASCEGANPAIDAAAMIYEGGYEVTFAGDAEHEGSAAHGPVARVNGNDL